MSGPVAAGTVEVQPCTPDRWPDVVAVFEGPGDPGRCWCQWFYRGGSADRVRADANREALQRQADERPPGVLGYLDGAAVGWCAVAQRPTYTRLTRSRVLAGTADDDLADPAVWAVRRWSRGTRWTSPNGRGPRARSSSTAPCRCSCAPGSPRSPAACPAARSCDCT